MKRFHLHNFTFVIAFLAIVYIAGVFRGGNTNAPSQPEPRLMAAAANIIKGPEISVSADLNKMAIYLYENGRLKSEYKIISKGDAGKWWRTPTGKIKIDLKSTNFWSDTYLVNLPWAVRIYDNFFIHGAPRDKDGKEVADSFLGGDIRLSDADAESFYKAAKIGTFISIYYENIENSGSNEFIPENLKNSLNANKFVLPVNSGETFIKWGFGNPTVVENQRGEFSKYMNHAGVDFAPMSAEKAALEVRAIADGKIVMIQKNDGKDNGLGNTIIIDHALAYNQGGSLEKIYSLYGHLKSFSLTGQGRNFKVGDSIKKGDTLGVIGTSGFGCEYWRKIKNECQSQNSPDAYLHFELKTLPILHNSKGDTQNYEYTPDAPERFGYIDPIKFISENL